MCNFTFIEEEKLRDNSVEIFNTFGTVSAVSDFAILLGGEVSSSHYTKEGEFPEEHAGLWWTRSVNKSFERCAVYADGFIKWNPPFQRTIGARPNTTYNEIKDDALIVKQVEDNILVVTYGEYPQSIVSKSLSTTLEEIYNDKNLKTTGKTYSADEADVFSDYTPFAYRYFIEYEYEDKKYIRIVGDSNCDGKVLSDGRTVQSGEIYWVKVDPIEWIVDEKEDFALSKQILFAGIAMDNNSQQYDEKFEFTNMKWFIDNYFTSEIIPSKIKIKENNKHLNLKKCSPYNFDFKTVSEEDIIRVMVESNIAVFLHGKSSDGKSARVKELDPDCEIIYLVNATPDSLNGKTVFNSNTNEMIDIPPTWYVKLKERCENEPDKIHIVFFDELTNAVPSIQSMAFNIVLNKEVNGKWKLPDNARIVAAGNEYEDSSAANEMVEPLFNRFAHVYINTTVEDWLKWASTPSETYKRLDYKDDSVPMKIHPSIYAYIAYKSYSKDDVLRMPYDGKTPNADPRKWELSSKLLYQTNTPEALRALIGEELTSDFVEFAKKQVISIEDVINENYTNEDLQMDAKEKYNTAVSLSTTSIEHIEKVRNFVKSLGSDVCDLFDILWSKNDVERLTIIEKLKRCQIESSAVINEQDRNKIKLLNSKSKS